MNNESQKKGLYFKIISDRFIELEAEGFVSLFCEGLATRRTPYKIAPLLDYQEWIKIPGIIGQGSDIKETAEDLHGIYYEEWLPKVNLQAAGSDEEIVKVQVKFLKKFGTGIPRAVWAYVLANELYPESLLLDTPEMELKPNFAIVNKILSPENGMKRRGDRRQKAEDTLMLLSIKGKEQAFINAFCDAWEAQPEPVIRDFEQLFSPFDWENLQDNVHKEEDLDELHAKGDRLSLQWKTELAKFQSEFLRKHGAKIPYFDLPKTLAYEAMKEEKYGGGETTQILKTMGIDY